MVPGSICSGSHSVTMLRSPTIVTSIGTAALSLCVTSKLCGAPPLAALGTSAPVVAARRLLLRGTAAENLSPDFPDRIAQAHPTQRLARVLENVDHVPL